MLSAFGSHAGSIREEGTPALAFKVAATAATPGMPNTGSDPSMVPVSPSQPFNPWYLGVLQLEEK